MKIVNLKVRNVKRIEAVDITPTDNTIVLAGANGEGKSSTLDSIAMALAGKKMIPERPVKDGEEQASIEIDLGDYIVTRHWTNPETSYLKVESPDGAKLSNGQTVLNKLVGNLTFDPLEFSTMDSKKRVEVLKDLTGLDFSDLKVRYEEAYSERTLLNRDKRNYEGQLNQYLNLPVHKIPEEDALTKIKARRKEADDHNKVIEKRERELRDYGHTISQLTHINGDYEKKIARLRAEIEELEEETTKNSTNIIKLTGEKQELEKSMKSDKKWNLEIFDKEIEEHYRCEKLQEKAEKREEIEQSITTVDQKVEGLNKTMKFLESEKQDRLSNADMPIKGLSLGPKDVLFNDVPFAQLSTSEQIRISMAMAISMNPKLRIGMIRSGSLLDSKAMQEVKTLAQEKDYQIWIERVADGPEADCIYIHDGKTESVK